MFITTFVLPEIFTNKNAFAQTSRTIDFEPQKLLSSPFPDSAVLQNMFMIKRVDLHQKSILELR